MAKFLTGKELNDKIYDIIWTAKEQLVIVSPFIKLDAYFKELFENHKHRHKLHILIVFGKNEAAPNKSLRKEDFDFFKQFKNITIVYCPALHAKYYANENEELLTSINLYDYSFANNIEYGVYYKLDFLDNFTSTADKDAWKYTRDLVELNPAIFVKRPVYEKSFLNKNYINSEVLYDGTDILLSPAGKRKELNKYIQDFAEEISANEVRQRPEKPQRQEPKKYIHDVPAMSKAFQSPKNESEGYCIRTGKAIPFNPSKPMSKEAYNSWAKWNNYDFEEAYCHKTGKQSFGKTSMRNPILK